MVRSHFLEVEHEYFLQILLKVDHQGKNFIILKCTSKMACFFDKNLVEIRIIELKLIEQISCEQIRQLSLRIFLYFFELIVQTILAFAYNLLQVLYFTIYMFFKHPCDIFFKLLYLLSQKSSNLPQFGINFKDGHVIFLIVFYLCFFPRTCRMQTT